jgi:hypothetical protein
MDLPLKYDITTILEYCIFDLFKNWARLIQKIYEVDPLTCPKCKGRSKIPPLAGMRILAFIVDEEVIKKILKQM